MKEKEKEKGGESRRWVFERGRRENCLGQERNEGKKKKTSGCETPLQETLVIA